MARLTRNRMSDEERQRLLDRARGLADYCLIEYIVPPVSRAEISVMGPAELRAFAHKYGNPMAGYVLDALDEAGL
jgi:hypothetical protein